MKIIDLETFVVATPPPHRGGRVWIFVKLTTDNGISGYGEVYQIPFHPLTVATMIEDCGGASTTAKVMKDWSPTNTPITPS